jgi:hypothetical protein
MFDAFAARMRHSDVNYRLLGPLLANTAAVQAVTAIVRVTTSYRVVELGLPVVWLGIVSATFAILPVFIAVWLGREPNVGVRPLLRACGPADSAGRAAAAK